MRLKDFVNSSTTEFETSSSRFEDAQRRAATDAKSTTRCETSSELRCHCKDAQRSNRREKHDGVQDFKRTTLQQRCAAPDARSNRFCESFFLWLVEAKLLHVGEESPLMFVVNIIRWFSSVGSIPFVLVLNS